jgi:hypothetical protein
MRPLEKYENTRVYRNFINKVSVDPVSGCWIWNGAVSDGRYGKFRIGGKVLFAHRASWLVHHGDIPDGLLICHKCDIERCVNPDHLFCGNQRDNIADMHKKGRWRSGNYGQHLKLTKDMAAMIRNSDMPHQKIADLWGISRTTVSCIKNYKTWIDA